MEVRIARIDTCPTPSHVVGYTILHKPSGKTLYLDAFIPLDESSETEIVKKGWEKVKTTAENWIEELDNPSTSLVGSVFDPSA